MALVKCPDCGKEVSDRSTACIFCGCPLNEETLYTEKQNDDVCIVDGKICDLSIAKNELLNNNYLGVVRGILDTIANNGFDDSCKQKVTIYMLQYYLDNKAFPAFIDSNQIPDLRENTAQIYKNFRSEINTLEKQNRVQNATIHCPNCGSANVKKISFTKRAASVTFFGLASSSINKQFECKSCGYKW